ncbi:MAG: hypothetical protein EOO39_45835 [Cytophagaceae bacterium]|nr:MAG: hypothetical protein EOO39_45835 [Cytophagaceae bacterium]
MLGWADVIFVMEKKHRDWINQRYADLVANKSVINLMIADEYPYMDDELVDMLTNRVTTHLNEL